MRVFLIITLLVQTTLTCLLSQPLTKQGNTLGADTYADAPFHMKKTDASGQMRGIPIHVFVHDASGLGSNIELMDVSIRIKNASDNVFNDLITFENLTDSAFQSLITSRSPLDSDLDIQDFDASGAIKDSALTINFTADYHTFPATTFVDITSDFWWFTITIPPDKLIGYEDIIDFEVYLGIDWATDYACYLRVFRYDDEVPSIPGWYRGDVHCHGMFTQNDAEAGLPLDATKLAASYSGLDWITFTDHSCDYDNYGQGMSQNWQHLGDDIALLNAADTSLIFIRGMEMSVNNSAGNIVHALVYPDPADPYSLPYIADGGGDLFSTFLDIDMMLDSLEQYNGFCYAAHPFAEGDALSSLVNGSVWNICDSLYPLNGEPHLNLSTVICNDTAYVSDVYSGIAGELAKDRLIGGQVWNLRNERWIDAVADNPWNVMNDPGADEFIQLSGTDYMHHIVRYMENADVVRHVWQKGLNMKNTNPAAKNWKFYLSAGSDAHGSFNYANTDFYYGVSGNVNDNALGRLTTLAFCPVGMGPDGQHVLQALKNGNTVLSSGPIVTIEIDTDTLNLYPEIIIGNDTAISLVQAQNTVLTIRSAVTQEYGYPISKQLRVYTEAGYYEFNLPTDTFLLEINLYEALDSIFAGQVPLNEYFLLFADMRTSVSYTQPFIYKMTSETFETRTNPIWLKINNPLGVSGREKAEQGIHVYPNPVSTELSVDAGEAGHHSITIYNSLGENVKQISANGKTTRINVSGLPAGVYVVIVVTEQGVVSEKIIFQ